MADNVEFKFTIVGGSDGGDEAPEQEAQQMGRPNANRPTQPVSTVKTAMAVSMGIDIAKQIGNQVTSNIGKWTGNSRRQQQIEAASKLVGYGVRIAVDPTPFKIASLASIGIEEGFNIANYYYDLNRERDSLEQERVRTGMVLNRNG